MADGGSASGEEREGEGEPSGAKAKARTRVMLCKRLSPTHYENVLSA